MFPAFISRNFRLKVLALVLGICSWASVVYASNPPDTKTVMVSVPQDRSSTAPYVLVQPIPDLPVRVSGTRDRLSSFTAADVHISPDYRGSIKGAGHVRVRISVTTNDQDVVIDQPPRYVDADVDVLGSTVLPVTVVIKPTTPTGYVAGAESIKPDKVTVTGPQKELSSLSAQVVLDFSSQKTNFAGDAPVSIVDALGNPAANIGVDPQSVQVSVQVTTSLTSRDSAVLPNIVGQVADGYELAGISVDPPTVVLQGPQAVLNGLDSVTTEVIDIGAATADHAYTVNLRPPAGVAAKPGSVTVKIHVIPLPPPSPGGSPTPAPSPTR